MTDGWEPRRLGTLLKLTSGQSPSGFTFGASGTPYFKVEQLGRSGKHLGRTATPYFSTDTPAVPAGSVLIAKRGAAIALNRVRLIVEPSFMDTNVMALTPNAELDSEFLYYWLSYRGLWDIADVTSVPQINNKHIVPLEIPLPSLDEQQRIVAVLRDFDDSIDTLERQIAKKQNIKRGLAQELLTARKRLSGFSGSWQPRLLSELLSYEQPTPYLVSKTDYVASGTPVLTAGKTFVLGHTDDQHGIYRALPVVIFDDFTTASKLVTFPFKAKSSAMKMLSAKPRTNLRFVYERMQLINFQAVDHKRRWISEYSRLEVLVPDEAEQTAIADVLADADAEIGALKRRMTKAKAIKEGMAQQLLTGRIRLPDLESAI